MKKLYIILTLSILFNFSFQAFSQFDYFHGQKNIFAIHLNSIPRFKPMKNDVRFTQTSNGLAYGTYYNKYNKDNELEVKQQKYNFMFNAFYGRLVKRRLLLGIDVSYQKHHLTMPRNGLYTKDWYEETFFPYTASSPVFNIIEAQFSMGIFLGEAIAPNQHLLQFQFGPRLFFLNKSQNYRYESESAYQNLDEFISYPNKPYRFMRLSINYTYRHLINENLSLDLGITSNFGLYGSMTPYDGMPYGYNFEENTTKLFYHRDYVKNRLGYETLLNVFYLKVGFSYAI